jgi:hypothetical protein
MLVLFAVASGCGEARVPVYPVTGKVTFQGKPPVGAQVVLHSVNPAAASDIAPSGTVKSDGSFAISAYDDADGAPQGEYVATVQWFKIIPEQGGRGPNVLPAKYASAKSSPIRVSVTSGPTNVEPIIIK